jgi:hypothetical protein
MNKPAVGWISEVVLDGPDPWALARFWAGLLGGTPVEWYPGWVTLEPPPNGQRLSFQATATPLAPDTARVHFDILVADLASAHDRVIEAGATPAGEHVSPRPAICSAWSFASIIRWPHRSGGSTRSVPIP